VFKALALGAQAVGIGRPPLYAMSAYGQEGIEKMLQILKSEFQMCMRLTGCATLADIKPEMVITTSLKKHITTVPRDYLAQDTYLPHTTQARLTNGYGPRGLRDSFEAEAAVNASTGRLGRDGSGGGGGGGGGGGTKKAAAPADPDALTPAVAAAVLARTVVGIAKTVFVPNVRESMNRTALLLIAFLFMHLAGNLAIFLGPETYNWYGHKLAINPLLTAVEYYLLYATVSHAFCGFFLTYKHKKMAKPARDGKLFMTSIVVLAFLVHHLWTFKYGRMYEAAVTQSGGSCPIGSPETHAMVRDLHKLVVEVFSDPLMVVWYAVAIGLLGLHVSLGWNKTVFKMGLKKEQVKPAMRLGQLLLYPLITGFVSIPVYVFLALQPTPESA
jgi:succinate dehydrogenase/fumarate reductase cytochrome b subunit (b558 family)